MTTRTTQNAFCIYDLSSTLAANLRDTAAAGHVWDEIHTVATLQGIVNRPAPRLYLRYVERDGMNIDDWWLARLSEPGAWLAAVDRQPIDTLESLIMHFRDEIRGAVIYDPQVPATSNVASAFAGAEDLVAIRHDQTPGSTYDRLVAGGPRLPIVRRLLHPDGRPMFTGQGTLPDSDTPSSGSAKCDAYLWALKALIETGKCDPRFLGYYIDGFWIDRATASVPNHHTLTNHDFFIARRAFFADLHCWDDETPSDDPDQPLGTDKQTLETVLRQMSARTDGEFIHIGGFTPWAYKYTSHPGAGGRHHGVLTEWELIRVVSQYGAFLDADAIGYGAMANASFFAHYPLRDSYPQASHTSTCEYTDITRAHSPPNSTDERQQVMFYVGDFDSAAWLYQMVPSFANDAGRKTAPLSWAISPVLARRAPMALDYLRRTSGNNEAFIAGNNGAGYLNPTMLPDRELVSAGGSDRSDWAEHCATHYARWQLTITGFLIDGLAPQVTDAVLAACATFSPDGIVSQRLDTPAKLVSNTPVLRAGPDIGHDDPVVAAEQIRDWVRARQSGGPLPDRTAPKPPADPEAARLNDRRAELDPAARGLPFFWFRTVLKSPGWHAAVVRELGKIAPDIDVVPAPTFFARLRRFLETH